MAGSLDLFPTVWKRLARWNDPCVIDHAGAERDQESFVILFFHGTSDDCTKPENWMPSVADLMRRNGETCLVIPGVASSQQNEVGPRGVDFIFSIMERTNTEGGLTALAPSTNAGLKSALVTAGREMDVAREIGNGGFEKYNDAFEKILTSKDEHGDEDYKWAWGIKARAAVGGLCGIAYYKYIGERHRRPIRIVGHSRGACAAVGAHNLLSYWGIPCTTLTLDACHGVARFTQKDYWQKIWAGRLHFIKAKKSVGLNFNPLVSRPNITGIAPGATTGGEVLTQIKHGHMGKYLSFSGGDKASQRALFAAKLMRVSASIPTGLSTAEQLNHLYTQCAGTGGDAADRRHIWDHLVTTLSATA